jgi:hypothetical protein
MSSTPQVFAHFHPQALIDDIDQDLDYGDEQFDVTHLVKMLGREKALKIKDNSQEADELWHVFTQERRCTYGRTFDNEHSGPFRIEVADAIREFYGVEG